MSCQEQRPKPWGSVRAWRFVAGVALFPAPAQAAPLYGETYLVSTSHEDGLFGDESEFAAISKDGRHAFWTTTESLLSADSDNDNVDIYERDIDARTTQLVTPGGDYDATFLGASEDGSKVFFATEEPIIDDSDAKSTSTGATWTTYRRRRRT